MRKIRKAKFCFQIVLFFIFVSLIATGCSSNTKLLEKQKEVFSNEQKYLDNFFREIKNAYTDVGFYETNSSLMALKLIENRFVLLRDRYEMSSFSESIPCEESELFVKYILEAADLGETAAKQMFKHYEYLKIRTTNTTSSTLSQSFHSYYKDAVGKIVDAAKQFETIREALADGVPFKK